MQLYLEGLLFGVVPVFFIGPVLFTLLHASLRHGFRAGATVAVGITVSDVVAIAACALGVGQIVEQPWGQWGLAGVGGLILLGFGAVMTFASAGGVEGRDPPAHPFKLFAAGFVVNFVNPFVFTFWIGAIGGVSARYGFTAETMVLFFGGVVTTIFVTDMLKARLATALERHLSGGAGMWAQRISGIALGGFGVYLLGKALVELPAILEGTGS